MLCSEIHSAKLKNPNYLSELYACKFDKYLLSIDIGCLRTDSQILIQITIAHNCDEFIYTHFIQNFVSLRLNFLEKKNSKFWNRFDKCIWNFNIVKLKDFPPGIMQKLNLL